MVGDRQGPGNKPDCGQRAGTRGDRDDNRDSGGADIMLFKQHQWPRSYVGGPTVPDWSRRYTCDPTDVPAWSQRYKSDPTDGDEPKTYTIGHDRDAVDVTRGPQASTRFKQAGFSCQPSTGAGQAMEESTTRHGDPAIAGDPMSATQRLERPRRAVRRPGHLKDFVL